MTTTEENVSDVAEIESNLGAAELAHKQGEGDETQIAEGSEIHQAVTDLTKVIEADPMNEQTAEAVNVVLEHFRTRTGYRRTLLPSMESFAGDDSRSNANHVAMENLTHFNAQLTGGMSIAQEGMLARLGNSIKLIFTSEEKIIEMLKVGQKESIAHGSKTRQIKTPGWGRSFSVIAEKELSGKDVLKFLTNYEKIMTGSDFKNIVEDYIKIIGDLSKELSKSRWIANNAATKAIQDLTDDVDKFRTKADKLRLDTTKTARNDPSFEPLTPDEVKKIGDLALKMMTDAKLNSLIRALENAVDLCNTNIFVESNTRIVKWMAADIRAAQQIVWRLNPVLVEIVDVTSNRARLCFACARYIKASNN